MPNLPPCDTDAATPVWCHAQERVLSFGNVELLSAKEGEDKNAAEMAVARG